MINEVGSCSSSMFGCGSANEEVAFSLGLRQVDGVDGLNRSLPAT